MGTSPLNHVVELILSIPIPVFQKEDCWAWTASYSGLFSVKSAYWLSRVESPPSNIDAVKGQIWKTKLHERLKMLLKRVAANLLPSKEIISRFNQSMDLCCPICSSTVETTLHLFMRNRSIFENVDINLEGVAAIIFNLFVEHKSARPPLVRPQVSASALGWSSPPRHGLKINVDAAVGPRFSVIATVTRDWRGKVVFAGSRKVNTTIPLQAEAEAVRWTLSLVLDLMCDVVFVETDSQVVAKLLLNSTVPPPWRIRFLCSDLRSFLSSYSNVDVSWVSRICNETDHRLAKWSLFCNFYGSFDVSFSPNCFSSVVLRESSGLL
ncbi:hypothetical protein SO802_006957 [Lithocarpus litseifolius]|uniref:RNase H type-1 domain-containing protein n=1 Tax=Lithocarpus litseifolius TaxID=425828 RepID=A0AAW2DP16_9ROSI